MIEKINDVFVWFVIYILIEINYYLIVNFWKVNY